MWSRQATMCVSFQTCRCTWLKSIHLSWVTQLMVGNIWIDAMHQWPHDPCTSSMRCGEVGQKKQVKLLLSWESKVTSLPHQCYKPTGTELACLMIMGVNPWAQKSYSDLGEKNFTAKKMPRCQQNLLFHLTYCRLEFQQIWLMEKNPAPVDMVNNPLFSGFYTSQVVQDFFPSTVWMVHDGLSLSWCFPNFATLASRSLAVHPLMITPQFIQIFWGAVVFIQKK